MPPFVAGSSPRRFALISFRSCWLWRRGWCSGVCCRARWCQRRARRSRPVWASSSHAPRFARSWKSDRHCELWKRWYRRKALRPLSRSG
ncbi:unnamed protein product [Ectocarpus sp. 13 AM-2016]